MCLLLGAAFSSHLPSPHHWHLSFLPCICFDEFPVFKVQVWVRLRCWGLSPDTHYVLHLPFCQRRYLS